jgi:hypothetical protein
MVALMDISKGPFDFKELVQHRHIILGETL